MKASSDGFSIGALAEAAGVSVETVRFYQRRRLLPEPERLRGTIRRYADGDLARVRFIKSAQRLGFSLDEVSELLKLEDGAHCDVARSLAERKLEDVRMRLADLRNIEAVLSQLVARCESSQRAVTCPLIASLQGCP